MNTTAIYRMDQTNVGDWYCAPHRYFDLGTTNEIDVVSVPPLPADDAVILGGGGLVAKTFHGHMQSIADQRPSLRALIAWGIGESENVDRKGGFVAPFDGTYPDYLKAFDLVGVRDYGTDYRWVPCASCMLPNLERAYPRLGEIGIYEHKRIKIPIEGFPRRSNDGADIDDAIAFLGSYELIITNSYHGAYWATLLGRRVISIPNMSKVYRFKHAPVICRAEQWKRYTDVTKTYDKALDECRAANRSYYDDVKTRLRRN